MQSLQTNGSFLQRRKMYIDLPFHNMKSKVKFDWQGQDISVQDQLGIKPRLKKENQIIKKKYNENLDKKIYHKYVQHEEQVPYALRTNAVENQEDTLEREVKQFNTSKMVTLPPPEKPQDEKFEKNVNLLQNNPQEVQKYNRSNDRLNQSYTFDPKLPSPKESRHSPNQQQQQYFQPEAYRDRSLPSHRYELPYYQNPQNYHTISPQTDRYRPFKPDPYPQYPNPSKYVQKIYTGTVPTDYPFRNSIPDKLQPHLRDKLKTERNSLKVNLNLFDYNRP